jgi:tripartite-type tricarboxylate transporter receptor subunit TctC
MKLNFISTPIQRCLATGLMLISSAMISQSATAQEYPNRPITLISPYSAGGDADTAARNFAAAAHRALKQPVVVMNRVGASGVIGSAQVIAAAPDGYTLLLARTGSQSILPAIQPTATKYKWDDYTFIGLLELNPYGCIVNAKSQYKTWDDLVKAMRSKGTNLNFGTAGTLTTNDMGPRLLFKLLKLTPEQTPTQIPYKGTGEATVSLMSGHTDFSCGSMGSFLPLVKSGALRALMTTNSNRMKALPDVPTARELNIADMESIVGWSALFGPPNLPADIRIKLESSLKAVAADPAWQASTSLTGSLPMVLSSEETRVFMQKQYQLYRSLGASLNLIDVPVQ